jgi:hypothetical protein
VTGNPQGGSIQLILNGSEQELKRLKEQAPAKK